MPLLRENLDDIKEAGGGEPYMCLLGQPMSEWVSEWVSGKKERPAKQAAVEIFSRPVLVIWFIGIICGKLTS